MRLSNRVLAIGALALAALAVIVRNPRVTNPVTLDLKELAGMVEREEDHVTAGELAAMLMAGPSHLMVIDVRDSSSYLSYHIPGARRLSLSDLVETKFQDGEPVVVYSEGGIHAAQAWMFLRARGQRNVFTLRGGLADWNELVLFPIVSGNISKTESERLRTRANFFGGHVRGNQSDPSKEKPLLKPVPGVTPKKGSKEEEKLREIC